MKEDFTTVTTYECDICHKRSQIKSEIIECELKHKKDQCKHQPCKHPSCYYQSEPFQRDEEMIIDKICSTCGLVLESRSFFGGNIDPCVAEKLFNIGKLTHLTLMENTCQNTQ